MQSNALLLLTWLSASAGLLHAQSSSTCGPLQVTVSPDPAPFGERIVITATNLSASLVAMPQPCLLMAVHERSPIGPMVLVLGCVSTIAYIPPGGSMHYGWDQKSDIGAQVAPGAYVLELAGPLGYGPCFAPVQIAPCGIGAVSPFGAGCGMGTCVSVFDLGPPQLTPQSCPQIGSTFELSLTKGDCGTPATLIMGASKTSFGGVPLPIDLGGGCLLHVSVDAVFMAPAPFGHAAFALPIPNDPALQGASAYFQGGSFQDGLLKLTHALAVVVG